MLRRSQDLISSLSSPLYSEIKHQVLHKRKYPIRINRTIATAVVNGNEVSELHGHDRTHSRLINDRSRKLYLDQGHAQDISRTFTHESFTETEQVLPDDYVDRLIRTLPPVNKLAESRREQLKRGVLFVAGHESRGSARQISAIIYERLFYKCEETGDSRLAKQIFDIAWRNAIVCSRPVWNRALCHQAIAGTLTDVIKLLSSMHEQGVQLESRSIVFVLKTLKRQRDKINRAEVDKMSHRLIDIGRTMGAYNEFLAVEEMTLLKLEKRFTDVVAVFQKEYGSDALRQFGFQVPPDSLPSTGYFEVNKYALSILLDALVQINSHPKSLFVLRRAYNAYVKDKPEFADDTYGPSIFIRALSNHTSTIPKALNMLDVMRKKRLKLDVVTYTNVIEGLCKNRMMDLAEQVLAYMDRDGIEPNEITYRILMKGYTAINHADGMEACRRLARGDTVKI